MSKITKNKLAALALAGFGTIATGAVNAEGMMVDSNGGIEVFELDSTDFWFKLGGRLLIDQGWYFADHDERSGFPDGARIRSARFTMKGGVGDKWIYKLDVDLNDFAGVDGGVSFGEAYVGYVGMKDFLFGIGQISIPFGLESWASLTDYPFMEASLASNAFSPPNGLGLYAEWHGHLFTLAGTVYHPYGAGNDAYGDVLIDTTNADSRFQTAGNGFMDSAPGSDDLGIAGRLTFSPVHDDYTVYHAGVSARHEHFHERANNFNYWAPMEVRVRQTPWLFTNIPPNSTQSDTVWGLELAGRWGPFILQGEYMWADVERISDSRIEEDGISNDPRAPGGDFDFYGYYVSATYVLTGEAREYDFDSGTFGSVHPKCKKGAWEIGARYGYVKLLDNSDLASQYYAVYADRAGNFAPGGGRVSTGIEPEDMVGNAHSTTIGLTYWLNNHVKFMANYVRMDLPPIHHDPSFSGSSEDDDSDSAFDSAFDSRHGRDINVFGLRAQVNW